MTNSTQCNRPGCDRAGKLTRGMCAKHYRNWLDHTPPSERGRPPRFARTFWDHVDKSGECWEWTGLLNEKGYGFWSGVGTDGRRGLAHRLSLAEMTPCPDTALFACHHCDNPSCVNPSHLYWGTAKDNARDVMERSGVWNKGNRVAACKWGHAMEGDNVRRVGGRDVCRECGNRRSRERQRALRAARPTRVRRVLAGEDHGCSKLTWPVVRQMRQEFAGGASLASLARAYSVSNTQVWRIVQGKAWKEKAQ